VATFWEEVHMDTISDDMRAQVKDVVCDILGLDTDEVTETSLFVDDHDSDSMRAIEILAALEITFEVIIPQSQLEHMINLAGIYQVLQDCLANSAV
jgi:acyl carrier protein